MSRRSLIQPRPVAIAHQIADPADTHWEGGVECDVVFSADHIPFVHHNYLLDEHDFIFDLASEEIQRHSHHPRTLHDVLSGLNTLRMSDPGLVLLDLKSGFQPRLQPHQALASVVHEEGWTNNAVILDWDLDQIAWLRGCDQELLLGAALRGRVPNLAALVAETGIDYLYLDWDLVRLEDVEACHTHGVAVGTLEGWHSSFYERVNSLEIDFVLSNDVAECTHRLRLAAGEPGSGAMAT